MVLSDLAFFAGEKVSNVNTTTGRDEKSDRRLDQVLVAGEFAIKPGAPYESKGRLTRRSSIPGSKGYVEVNGRLKFQEPGMDPADPRTFLKLRFTVPD